VECQRFDIDPVADVYCVASDFQRRSADHGTPDADVLEFGSGSGCPVTDDRGGGPEMI